MRFFCPACGTPHVKPNQEIAQTGSKVDCTQCRFSIQVKLPKRKKALGAPPAPIKIKNKTPEYEKSKNAWDDEVTALNKVDDDEQVDEECRTVEFVAEKQYLPSESKESAREQEAAAPPEASQPAQESMASESQEVAEGLESAGKDSQRLSSPAQPAAHKKAFCPGRGQYRFRDLIYALQVPFDYRKTLIVALGFFVGFLLLAALLFLAAKTQSSAAQKIGGLVGLVVFSTCFFVGAGASAFLTGRELELGHRLPVYEGYLWMRANLFVVIGFPLAMFASLALLGSAIGILLLIARIPYVGPVVYGLTFGVTLLLGVLMVLLAVVALGLIYSYIPVCEGHGVWGLIKRMWQLFRINPFRYALNLSVTVGIALVLAMIVQFVYAEAFSMILNVDGWVGGGELGGMLAEGPSSFLLGFKNSLVSLSNLSTTTEHGVWPLRIAGWLAATSILALVSIAVGFVWTYFSAAGVINVHLVTQEEK